jgi:protein gp37
MAENTKIEWADHTFNPWIGCAKVGPGCDHCYAEALAERYSMAEWGPKAERKRTGTSNWHLPRRWAKRADRFFAEHGRRQRVFCASLADVFDNQAPAAWRADLLDLIEATPELDWLLLTKRIGNVEGMLTELGRGLPTNVWLGITVVNQDEANRDVPKLLTARATKRFLSMEPLLGEVNLRLLRIDGFTTLDALTGQFTSIGGSREPLPALDQILVGGESGTPRARPMHPNGPRSLRDQCAATGTAFLFKQWGEWLPRSQVAGTSMRVSQFSDGQVTEIDGESFLRAGKKWSGRKLDGVIWNGEPK